MSKKQDWENRVPESTQEELQESFNKMETYLYKILDYSNKEDIISPEELNDLRRDYIVARVGPRAGYLLASKRSKLTSADVLYFLTCAHSAELISRTYDVNVDEIKDIRRGVNPTWIWEYKLIRRLKNVIRGGLFRYDITRRIYRLSVIKDDGSKEHLVYASSIRKASNFRKDIIDERHYKYLQKKELLEVIYPIELIEII